MVRTENLKVCTKNRKVRTKNMSVRKTAQKLGYTLKYIFDLLYADKLEGAIKSGGRWQIPAGAVEKWRIHQTHRKGGR